MFNNLFHLTATADCSRFDGVPRPVMYRKQPRYRIDKFDFCYAGQCSFMGGGTVLYEIFLQKSDEWIYEKEHRIILRLEQADKVIIFDLDQIENPKTRKSVIELECCKSGVNENNAEYYEITLCDISNKSEREWAALELAKLSLNPQNIYFFKLKPNAFTHCLLGLNYDQDYEGINIDYARSPGYFEFWKAKQNELNYHIEFEELCSNP